MAESIDIQNATAYAHGELRRSEGLREQNASLRAEVERLRGERDELLAACQLAEEMIYIVMLHYNGYLAEPAASEFSARLAVAIARALAPN